MAKFTQIPANTFKEIQLNAGVLCSAFDPVAAKVTEGSIFGATSGGVNFTATPSFTDFGEDIDNCPANMKEFKKLDSVEAKMTGTYVTVNTALGKQLAAAADVDASTGKITPRSELKDSDFADVWFVGDYSDVNDEENGGFIAIRLIDALSTGGFQIQTTTKAKGQFAFEYTGHYSMEDPTKVPYELYIKAGKSAASHQAAEGGQPAVASADEGEE